VRRAAPLTIAILLMLLTGCSGAAEADSPLTMRSVLDSQKVRLDMPFEAEPLGTAVWFHGQGGDADFRMDEDWLNTLRENGWAVASGDMRINGWGNAASVSDAAALVDWAEGEAGAEATLYVAGSMGALTSLHLMAGGVAPQCWYGIMPVIDLDSVEAVPNSAEQIAEAWGSTKSDVAWVTDLPESTAYRVLASPDDTWVPESENAAVLAEALPEMSLKAVAGEHGDASHFDAADLAAFAAGCYSTSQ
jgi:hypothetical protein